MFSFDGSSPLGALSQSSRTLAIRMACGTLGCLFFANVPCRADDKFRQTNLVSSVAGQAVTTDPNLKNPWGISLSGGSPFWVSNQVTGTATLYNGAGQRFPVGNPLVVNITSIGGPP